LAVQFLVAQPEWRDNEWYVPAWDELIQIMIPLLAVRGQAADLARYCDREPWDISRYFSRWPTRRREPDGEVALATLDWLTRRRVEYSMADNGFNPLPPPKFWQALERAFALELKFRKARALVLGRDLHLPDDDIFC
jgi:hypothetical protein